MRRWLALISCILVSNALECIAVAGEPVVVGLREEVLEAVRTRSALAFEGAKKPWSIRFIDSESLGCPPDSQPIFFAVDETFTRRSFGAAGQIEKMDVEAANQAVSKYAALAREAGSEPVIQLWIKKGCNEELLANFLKHVADTRIRQVRIALPTEGCGGYRSIYVHKPVPPKRHRNPTLRRR